MLRQPNVWTQADRGHNGIHADSPPVAQCRIDSLRCFVQRLKALIKQQFDAHLVQSLLQTATDFRRYQRGEQAGGVIQQNNLLPGAAKIHRQLCANQTAAQNHHALRLA
ncbi:hypothetical protein D3C75_815290 [compost metagenome]